MAAAIGAGLPVHEPAGNMIVDIGGGTTEVAVISLGGIVASESIRIAGDELDEAIITYVKKEYSLALGERTSEEIKIALGERVPACRRSCTRRSAAATSSPVCRRRSSCRPVEIREAIEEPVAAIVDAVKVTLDKTPPGRRARDRRRTRTAPATRRPACSSTTPTARARRCSPRWRGWPPRSPPSWSTGGLTIVGITGSSGKTSTKDLLAAVLAPLGEVVAPPGSFNNELGHPWTVLRATEATDYLVLEMSARHPGNIAALAAIAPPSIAVVLNVGTAHLGEFGSREAIAATKAELPQAVPSSGVVILNVDDTAVAAMAEQTAARVVRVSRSHGGADVWAGPVTLDELARPRFTLHAARRRGRHRAGRARRPPGVQRAVRRRRRAGMRRHARTGGGRAGRGGPGVASTACRSPPATTASRSSTTPTTPTRTPCGPG